VAEEGASGVVVQYVGYPCKEADINLLCGDHNFSIELDVAELNARMIA